MDLSTQTHLTALRELLTFRLHELQAEVHAAELGAREAGTRTHEVHDQDDEATRRALSDVGGAEEQRDVDELAQVQAALRRLDAGEYGDCVDCGGSIPLERLRVQPAAARCAACQAAFEARRR
jgi:RNA polymerase-binding transcription factor DksA